MSALTFPSNFRFGTSTASFQIEGGTTDDGRGRSIWDTFADQPGRILDGSTGAVTADHYHRSAEDIALMARLGAHAYRFSIAWPRIQPTGSGSVNPAGLGFYDRLVDALLAEGIEPMATLYHWDLPQPLEDAGGWLSRETALRFGDYAAIVAEKLADRVAYWAPINEPNVAALMGYALGMHAPGKELMFDALPAAHHLLLGHGLAIKALRAAGAKAVGTATNHMPAWPDSDSAEDKAAADMLDTIWNRIYADPILLGRYPEGYAELFPIQDGDLELINQPLDFYGMNYYFPQQVRAGGPVEEMPFEQVIAPGYPTTDFGWPIVPRGLRELFDLFVARYPNLPPIFITESGCAFNMGPDAEGVVDDQPRIDYLDAHLQVVSDAIADGIDIRGYFAWSLMDNWEWTEGFTQRFGLVHIDYDTLVRTPKRSYDWYAGIVAAHRAAHPEPTTAL